MKCWVFCASRWGIYVFPVPKPAWIGALKFPLIRDYVTYVWFDALVNYISAPGYGSDDAKV